MLKNIFSRKYRQVNITDLPQLVPFEKKTYVKNELDGFLLPTNNMDMTKYYKHFIY